MKCVCIFALGFLKFMIELNVSVNIRVVKGLDHCAKFVTICKMRSSNYTFTLVQKMVYFCIERNIMSSSSQSYQIVSPHLSSGRVSVL